VIYRNGSRNNIHVSKLDAEDLLIQKTEIVQFNTINSGLDQPSYQKNSVDKETSGYQPQGPKQNHANRDLDDILNGFIICGRIYFLQYHGSQNAIIRLMFDLYHLDNRFSYLQSIEFIQPYRKNTQLTYNPYDKKLYAWDSEYLLTYSLELV